MEKGIVAAVISVQICSVHLSDLFRKITLILRYILQYWFIDNIIVVAYTG